MKTILLVGLIFFLTAAGAGSTRSSSATSFAVPCWPENTIVNVYFVRDLFSVVEKQTLQEAMTSWTSKPENRDAGISFTFAGESGGLVDCANCLTIARHGIAIERSKQRVAINALRQDNAGQLVSAWIAFERAADSPTTLRNKMLDVLQRSLRIGSRAGRVASL
ncbi:MAG TPA: hypothetical protein VLL54_20240 [Pyrinomonadaceae bacterium]|nr:hypothetical protein [Pyrinomonadaceae bacterium]